MNLAVARGRAQARANREGIDIAVVSLDGILRVRSRDRALRCLLRSRRRPREVRIVAWFKPAKVPS